MFCLRSWIPVLFFLLRTHASPVYLVLFISATYFLNRPCVYCSLLLFILVAALFDFHTPWFDSPLPGTTDLALNGTAPLLDTMGELVQVANHTAQALAKGAVDGIRAKVQGSGGPSYEWVRGLLGKKEWRVQCLDVLIRV
ncbi:hypothetical protein P153DRAFT_367420 [Dothidotthia symphoricarpi CBS 119687]|uniref:Uncharacterized protein n=1 Tax=Dothidotthia symphoricarpi CBS 119687 TaxID=1392245 RepID=A0A6A6ADF3_9PLEO|nr:uncharacterized protein P153DRAFT_367420 [Dothidotthia symphoricarpi CBS 119687]KAF2129155.1 hypothetical protein P153DRAFT_367420 [Dothidotthia symphoricarpi CBS 119687]